MPRIDPVLFKNVESSLRGDVLVVVLAWTFLGFSCVLVLAWLQYDSSIPPFPEPSLTTPGWSWIAKFAVSIRKTDQV
jgi:hypothetical protein